MRSRLGALRYCVPFLGPGEATHFRLRPMRLNKAVPH